VGGTLLPCRHTLVPGIRFARLRPARVFGPLFASLNCLRIPLILRAARRVIRESGSEAILTATNHCEFNLAAYFLHRETGLPLYWFETDDWEIANAQLLPRWLVRRYRLAVLGSVTKLWVTSPAMGRDYRERFGVEGEFLFHFVEPDRYAAAARAQQPPPAPHPVELVYAGSINFMFLSTMRALCRYLNEGLEVDGRRVRLTIYGPACPQELQGPGVSWGGLVNPDDVPAVLARAHALLIAVTFDQDPGLIQLVKTSLYTKTVDYLASGRPVLVVSPPYTAEIDYFGGVTHVVPTPDRAAFEAAVRKLVRDHDYAADLARRGQDLVRRRHSPEALDQAFLRHFRGGAA
jgi:glycosyltransferase involved in cell wall biosynthesis